MTKETDLTDYSQEIINSRISEVELSQPLVEAFQVASSVTQENFFLIGSGVRKCILNESGSFDDVDFIGNFDLDRIQKQFGNQVVRRLDQFCTVKIIWGDIEIDFISNTSIKKALEGSDITLSLMCIDKNGVVYDPLNYIDDFRRKLIRIENAEDKIRVGPDRILRVLRFTAELGYEVEDLTKQACISNASLMNAENTEYALKKLLNMDPGKRDRALEIAEKYGILDCVKNIITDKCEGEFKDNQNFNSTRLSLERFLGTPDFFIFGGALRDIILKKQIRDIDVKLENKTIDATQIVELLESKGFIETMDITLPKDTYYINRAYNVVSFRVNGVLFDVTFTEAFDPVKWQRTSDINLNGLVFDNKAQQLLNRDLSFYIAIRRLEFCSTDDKDIDSLKVTNALKQMSKIEGLRVSDESLGIIRSNISTIHRYFQANPGMLYKLKSIMGNPFTTKVVSLILGCQEGVELLKLLETE